MQRTLSYRHRVITGDDLVFIRKLVAEHPGLSRWGLSKKLCQAWNWVQANGALRDMVCRGLMLMLHREGLIELPPVRQVIRNPLVERSEPALVSVDQAPLQASFAELGALEIRQVRRTPEEALFNSLLQQHHYLAPPPRWPSRRKPGPARRPPAWTARASRSSSAAASASRSFAAGSGRRGSCACPTATP